jgi:hypothetical protein
MIEHRTVRRARELAELWHAGQLDKTGEPYTGHLRRVAVGTRAAAGPYLTRAEIYQAEAAAWLHDLLEDTDCPWPDLSRAVPTGVQVSVMSLTHAAGEPWVDYMRRIASDPNGFAPFVKWADIADNADPRRLEMVREVNVETWQRMVAQLPHRIEHFRYVMGRQGIRGPWLSDEQVYPDGSSLPAGVDRASMMASWDD